MLLADERLGAGELVGRELLVSVVDCCLGKAQHCGHGAVEPLVGRCVHDRAELLDPTRIAQLAMGDRLGDAQLGPQDRHGRCGVSNPGCDAQRIDRSTGHGLTQCL